MSRFVPTACAAGEDVAAATTRTPARNSCLRVGSDPSGGSIGVGRHDLAVAPGEQGSVDLEVDVVLDELDVAVGECDIQTARVAADGAPRVREVRVGWERRRAAAEFARGDHALGRVVGPYELIRTGILRDPA